MDDASLFIEGCDRLRPDTLAPACMDQPDVGARVDDPENLANQVAALIGFCDNRVSLARSIKRNRLPGPSVGGQAVRSILEDERMSRLSESPQR